MILHHVFLRYRADVTAEERAAILDAIGALKLRIPGMAWVKGGRNLSPEGLDRGHSEGFVVGFTDTDARDRYLADEEHGRVGARIVAATEGGIDGVFVFDLETA